MSARPDIPISHDTEDQPALLIRRNPNTGKLAWKRTGKGPWIGRFDTINDATVDAERLGLKPPYTIEFVDPEEEGEKR